MASIRRSCSWSRISCQSGDGSGRPRGDRRSARTVTPRHRARAWSAAWRARSGCWVMLRSSTSTPQLLEPGGVDLLGLGEQAVAAGVVDEHRRRLTTLPARLEQAPKPPDVGLEGALGARGDRLSPDGVQQEVASTPAGSGAAAGRRAPRSGGGRARQREIRRSRPRGDRGHRSARVNDIPGAPAMAWSIVGSARVPAGEPAGCGVLVSGDRVRRAEWLRPVTAAAAGPAGG